MPIFTNWTLNYILFLRKPLNSDFCCNCLYFYLFWLRFILFSPLIYYMSWWTSFCKTTGLGGNGIIDKYYFDSEINSFHCDHWNSIYDDKWVEEISVLMIHRKNVLWPRINLFGPVVLSMEGRGCLFHWQGVWGSLRDQRHILS